MNPQTTVGEIAATIPVSIRVFDKYRIDFCCNGKRPLEAACQEVGVSSEALRAEIEGLRREAAPARDWNTAPLGELMRHIVERHHKYLETELPHIDGRMDKVVGNHSGAKPWLKELQQVFLGLAGELRQHLRKEEQILFPYIDALEKAERFGVRPPNPGFGSAANPVRMMMVEHEGAGSALARMRELSSGFERPSTGCPGFGGLMHDLAQLEADLHEHIHLENNILFPRAVGLEHLLHTR
jgi:regulator of cell morphogenesis and NO signaling